MNYMKQIAEMIGVEMGEKFDIKTGETIIQECYIDQFGLHDDAWRGMPKLLLKLLMGNAEIIKKPFRPEVGDLYWVIRRDGNFDCNHFNHDTYDIMAMYMGNCFYSKAEAELHKDEILAKFQDAMSDDRQ